MLWGTDIYYGINHFRIPGYQVQSDPHPNLHFNPSPEVGDLLVATFSRTACCWWAVLVQHSRLRSLGGFTPLEQPVWSRAPFGTQGPQGHGRRVNGRLGIVLQVLTCQTLTAGALHHQFTWWVSPPWALGPSSNPPYFLPFEYGPLSWVWTLILSMDLNFLQ